jgi:hypothetical protein
VIVPDRPQRTTSLRAVEQAAIPAPTVSWLSAFGGSIWAKRDDGSVIRVDPHTNKQTGQVGSYTDGQHYCQGIAAGGGSVWSCQQGLITRIDPKTVRIIAKIPIAKAFDEGRYAFADGRIWVITGTYGNHLVGIDTATNQPGPAITLPYGCSDLAPGGNALWVLCPLANHVVKVDVTHRRVAGTVAIDSAYNGYASSTDLWVGSSQNLVRIDGSTLKPTVIFQSAGPGQGGDITIDANHVWVSTNDNPTQPTADQIPAQYLVGPHSGLDAPDAIVAILADVQVRIDGLRIQGRFINATCPSQATLTTSGSSRSAPPAMAPPSS